MKKHFFKLTALLLVAVTLLSIPMPAMAAETEYNIPAHAIRNTVEFTIQPGEELTANASSVMPRIWEQNVYNVPYGTTTYTPQFVIPHRYFAYEFSATSPSTVPSNFTVNLLYHGIQVTGASTQINQSTPEKVDWIDVYAGDSYYFQIINNATSEITVTLTYYSWA